MAYINKRIPKYMTQTIKATLVITAKALAVYSINSNTMHIQLAAAKDQAGGLGGYGNCANAENHNPAGGERS
jgi:hypothetical protein